MQKALVLISELPLLDIPLVILLLRGSLFLTLGLFTIALVVGRLIGLLLVRVVRQVSEAAQGPSVFVVDTSVYCPHDLVGMFGDSILIVEVYGLYAGESESVHDY
ncbi:hypothetical protein HG530_003037 [Fusarium avenaceum]|nr:hypothetical protein HG530_003037 [Fusarium avenaceum]